MKIYDCFMYFDEDLILDIRFNILNKYVDYFVIVESRFNHNGDKRDLKFNFKRFKKFKKKIIYLVQDKLPEKIQKIHTYESEKIKERKYILNAIIRENAQRNYIEKGLKNADKNDLVLISDVDEIPNLDNLNLAKINKKIIIFKQIMSYYKFNLAMPKYDWYGTKGCLKKYLHTPQWLRNVKSKKYSKFRLDILFSKKRYNNIHIVKKGGWHFTNLKEPKQIEKKFKSYLHHREFELSGMNIQTIENVIKNRIAIYDLKVDQRSNKIGIGSKLTQLDDKKLPKFIIKNKKKFSKWFI